MCVVIGTTLFGLIFNCLHLLVFPDGPAAGQQDGGNPDEKGDSCEDEKGKRDGVHTYFFIYAQKYGSRASTLSPMRQQRVPNASTLSLLRQKAKFFLFLNLE